MHRGCQTGDLQCANLHMNVEYYLVLLLGCHYQALQLYTECIFRHIYIKGIHNWIELSKGFYFPPFLSKQFAVVLAKPAMQLPLPTLERLHLKVIITKYSHDSQDNFNIGCVPDQYVKNGKNWFKTSAITILRNKDFHVRATTKTKSPPAVQYKCAAIKKEIRPSHSSS